MKVFVSGVGIMGLQIARALRAEGNEVTALEISPNRVEKLQSSLEGTVVEGDCCDPAVLERAGLSGHDAFLALTGDDEDNLVSSLLAKTQFNVNRVVARVNDPRNSWLFDERWGVDVAMSAPNILLSLIEEATSARQTVDLMELATAGVRLVEVSIGSSNPNVGRALGSVEVPAGFMVAAVIRGGRPSQASDEVVLEAGDQLLVLVARDAARHVEELFSSG